MENLGITEEMNTTIDFKTSDPVDLALLEYKYHSGVVKIEWFVGENIPEFHFSETTIESIENEIKKLNVSRKVTFKTISPKGLLETLDLSKPILLNIWNKSILYFKIYGKKISY